MKRTVLTLASIATLAVLLGCASTTPPTATEKLFATVVTNYVDKVTWQTNLIVLVTTNTVVNTVTVTNEIGVPTPVYYTNLSTVTSYATNIVLVTNTVPTYSMTPNATATTTGGIIGSIANIFAPGSGGLVTSVVLGLLSVWLGYRNRQFAGKNDTLTQAAAALTQIIETGREIMSKTPQGATLANQFTTWMITHQAETQTIAAITQLVKDNTNNADAKAAADQILALMSAPPKP